jgi:hypothetical protein
VAARVNAPKEPLMGLRIDGGRRLSWAAAMTLALLGLSACAGMGKADTADLTPHRAYYAVRLGAAAQGGGVTGARGTMSMTFEKSCEGWVMQQQMQMALETSEGRTIEQDTRYGGLESYDGLNYRFGSFSRSDDDKTNFRGSASMGRGGKTGKARYVDPSQTYDLPDGTVFPTTHTQLLISEAKKGVRFLVKPLFDGTEGKGAEQVSTFIGLQQDPEKISGHIKVDDPLLNHPGWPIRMAVFEMDKNDPTPEYEMGFLQLDNGITPSLEIDYHDFTLIFDLQKIEPLPQPHC